MHNYIQDNQPLLNFISRELCPLSLLNNQFNPTFPGFIMKAKSFQEGLSESLN